MIRGEGLNTPNMDIMRIGTDSHLGIVHIPNFYWGGTYYSGRIGQIHAQRSRDILEEILGPLPL